MKRLLFLVTGLLIIETQVAGQNKIDRSASFKNYGQYLQPYISSSHNAVYKKQFSGYCEDYVVVVKFNIDTSGNIINTNTISDKASEIAVSYVMDLLKITSHQWEPQVKDGKEVVSDTITCFFYLFNNLVTPKDRGRKASEEIEKVLSDDTYKADYSPYVARKSEINYCYVFLRI
ncbi:MAG: hypothetical protein WDO71_28455 [Bacteroidota bacterium]